MAISDRFYLRPTASPPGLWREVSRTEYVRAERVEGFRSKFGPDEPATYAFGGSTWDGTTRHPGQPAPSSTADAADSLP